MKGSLTTFLEKVRFSKDGCWEWVGAKMFQYGSYGGTTAHRWLWKKLKNRVRKDQVLDHLCEHKLCVNPLHLEAVSKSENSRRHIERHPIAPDVRKLCMRGHLLVGDNLYTTPNNRKRCRICKYAADKKRRKKKKGCLERA